MRNFAVLSDIEFEEIAADLLSADLGTNVERFAAGRDGGVDLRWAGGTCIAQCKHYIRSTFAQLIRAARNELPKVEALSPTAYRFITTFDLSVTQKQQLYSLFQDWMPGPECVLGGGDVDALLTRHEQVERRHPKLWLSSGTQLFWSLHSDLANRAAALQARIDRSLPQYVMNSGYSSARSILDKHRVCVIAGVPGIGKTMLAYVLVAHAITLGYEPMEVSADIEEAWAGLATNKPQVFLYDDFLGELSFAERLGKNEDRRLSDFVEKIRTTQTKLLIMTTREYVLKAAQQEYERLRAMDQRLHFVLALSDYTRADRARILYNHLWHANLSEVALKEIAAGGYKAIVDHSGYNPRLIEFSTGEAFDTSSKGYPSRVVEMLSHPERLWRTAFEKHLTKIQQLLAVTMATLPARTPVEDLQTAHMAICRALHVPCTVADVRSSLAAMEGTFLTLERSEKVPVAAFHNPSIRDFVVDWLSEDEVLFVALLQCAPFFEQIRQVYSVASPYFDDNQAHSNLKNLLNRCRAEFVVAIKRTITGPSPERRMQWIGRQGNVFGPPVGWFEERLLFCLGLPVAWQPSEDWFLEQISALSERWQRHEGSKAKAVELMRELETATFESPHGIDENREELMREAGSALDSWLQALLEETEEDWAPYLDRLEHDHGTSIADNQALVEKFEHFVEDEFDRWSPSPPNLDMLLAHAKKFDASSEVLEKIRAAIREGEEEDRATGEQIKSTTPTAPALRHHDSDEELCRLFQRFLLT